MIIPELCEYLVLVLGAINRMSRFLCLSGLSRCCGFLIHCDCLLLRSGGLQSRLIHRGGCQLCSGGSLLHRGRLLLCSGGLQSHLIHRGGCQLCSGGPRLNLLHHGHLLLCSGGLQLCLIHCGGCQLCSGGLQFHSGSMLHWLSMFPAAEEFVVVFDKFFV